MQTFLLPEHAETEFYVHIKKSCTSVLQTHDLNNKFQL